VIPRKFIHFNPPSVQKTLSLLQQYGDEARVIAGGVDLVNALKHEFISPKVLINPKIDSGLAGMIEEKKKGLSIGGSRHLVVSKPVHTFNRTSHMHRSQAS
jgi:carbon-monoxide dehydrogenase medium subunit